MEFSKKILSVLFVFSCLFYVNLAQGQTEDASPKPDKVKIGIYVTDIFGFDMASKSFDAVFWVWLLYSNSSLDLAKSLDIVNARESKVLLSSKRKIDNYIWDSMKYDVRIVQDWNLENFPFDKQKLYIYFEDTNLEANDLVFVPDKLNSKIDEDIRFRGWNIVQQDLYVENKQYTSNYGDITSPNKSIYSRAVFKIVFERNSTRAFIESFSITYLSAFLCFCVFFLPFTLIGSRLSLLVGSIFAAVGNKIVIDRLLPVGDVLTLADKIQLSVFILLAYTILMTLIAHTLHENGKEKMAKTINRISLIFAAFLLIGANIYLIYSALN